MTANGQDPTRGASSGAPSSRGKNRVVLVVIVAFFVLLLVKLAVDGTSSPAGPAENPSAGGSLTSTRNDAVADFEAALASGKPIYVLFHSLTCQPCVEISAVADRVVPEYADRVVFVNAITDDPSGQQLASRFAFQYIPQSFFLAPGATAVVDSFTGAMDEGQMRAYLDALVEAQ